jgi:uncharacterized protein (DUF488 family)
MDSSNEPVVMTIGHSTLSLDKFTNLLKINDVSMVVDIRTIPRSRHNPQFNKEFLSSELIQRGIEYLHMTGLGGLRHPLQDSPNDAWHNLSFRGFADYMQTKEFAGQINKLINLTKTEQLVLMCAEAVPWRCHRLLIADALLIRNIKVEHILNQGKRRQHTLTPWAEVQGDKIIYPLSKFSENQKWKINESIVR